MDFSISQDLPLRILVRIELHISLLMAQSRWQGKWEASSLISKFARFLLSSPSLLEAKGASVS